MPKQLRVSSLILSGTVLSPANIVLTGATGNYVDSAINLGAGSGLYNSKVAPTLEFKSLSAGSGLFITGNASGLTITSYVGQNVVTGLGANVAMTNANQYYQALSNTVGAGTWFCSVSAQVMSPANLSFSITARIGSGISGSTFYDACEHSCPAMGAGVSGQLAMSLQGLITLTGASNAIVLGLASTTTGCIIAALPQHNNTSIANNITTEIEMFRLF